MTPAQAATPQPEPVGEVIDMKYNAVRFFRRTGDLTQTYLQPRTKLYTAPPDQAARIALLEGLLRQCQSIAAGDLSADIEAALGER